MKYQFPNYEKANTTIRSGFATILIVEGIAEIDESDPQVMELVKAFEGQPVKSPKKKVSK